MLNFNSTIIHIISLVCLFPILGSAAPYSQSVIDAGIKVWRDQPDSRGRSCTDCHGAPDAFELAYFNYTDADIRRRGTPNHVGTVDTEKIVKLVKELRKKYDIINPLNPRTTRVFQPGGAVLPGANATERDFNFAKGLERSLPMLAAGTIRSAEDAQVALDEIKKYDLRTQKIGIKLPIWSEDISFGSEHGRVTDWIVEEGFIPTNTESKAKIFAAQDTYLADPTEDNFWNMFKVEQANGRIRSTVTNTNQRNTLENKYLNALIGAHDLRMLQLKRPLIMDKNNRHTQFYYNGPNLVKIQPTFMVGDVLGYQGEFDAEILSGLDPKYDTTQHVELGRDPWWWMGFIYNPSLETEAERQEYFPNDLIEDGFANGIRKVDQDGGFFALHSIFLRAKSDVSYFMEPSIEDGNLKPFNSGRHNPLSPFNMAPALGVSLPIDPYNSNPKIWFNDEHREIFVRFSLNVSKMRLYLLKNQLTPDDLDPNPSNTAAGRYDVADLGNARVQLTLYDKANVKHNLRLLDDIEELREAASARDVFSVKGSGNGLTGQYFNSLDFTSPMFTRTDPKLDFVNPAKLFRGADGAIQSTSSSKLSVRWTGFYQPEFSGSHNFWAFMAGDLFEVPIKFPRPGQGKARVWVNDVLVFDMWTENFGLQPNPQVSFPGVTLEAGKTYPIKIEFKQEGDYQRFSLWSSTSRSPWNPIKGSQLYTDVPLEQAPAAAGNLTASDKGSELTLSWADYSYNETGFRIQRRTASSGIWEPLADLPTDTTTYNDRTVRPSTAYSYRIIAYNSKGDSVPSGTLTVATSKGPFEEGLLLYESFSYPKGALSGSLGGRGWMNSSAWTGDSTVVEPLSFSDYGAIGNAVKVAAGNAGISRDLGITVNDGATVWMSYLFRDNGGNDYNDEDALYLTDSAGTKFRTVPARRGGKSAVGVGSGLGADGANKLANKAVYLIIVKFTNVGSGNQTAKMWGLSEANYEAVKYGGISETELDGNNRSVTTATSSGSKSIILGDSLVFYNRRSDEGYIDELKIGLSLGSLFANAPDPVTKSNLEAWSERVPWGTTSPALRGALADPDGDSMVNLLEMALGQDPTKSQSISYPKTQSITRADGSVKYILSYPKEDPLARFLITRSTDLINWTSEGLSQEYFNHATGLYERSFEIPNLSKSNFFRLEVRLDSN